VEVDDKEAQFSADLANAHAAEVTKLLGRLAVSEAQQRRVFFEQQLKDARHEVRTLTVMAMSPALDPRNLELVR